MDMIHSINSINFNGTYVSKHQIKKINDDGSLTNKRVALVRLDANSDNDANTLSSVNASWMNGYTFADKINDDLMDYVETEGFQRTFLALTTQKKNFRSLVSEKVVGLAELIHSSGAPDEVKIKYIQVNPKQTANVPNRTLKEIGTAILDGIKSLYPTKDLALHAGDDGLVAFYKKNGFILESDGCSMLFKR